MSATEWTDESGNPVSGNVDYNNTYKVKVTLKANEGYIFTSSTTANDIEKTTNKTVTFNESEGTLTVTYTFVTDKTILSVEVTGLTAPIANENLDSKVTCSTTGIHSESIEWKYINGSIVPQWEDMARYFAEYIEVAH